MAAESTRKFEALEAQASSLMEVFVKAGYEPVAPTILQPADVFLDQIGEAIRGRTYVFTDPEGEELCLRPDLTVPTCRLYLERHPEGSAPARYCYNGPAFRYQPGGISTSGPREFRQAGVESLGAADKEKAETEVVSLAEKAVRDAGISNFVLKLGDRGLFLAFLNALEMPERWRLRLSHFFWRPAVFHQLLMGLCNSPEITSGSADKALLRKINPENAEESEEVLAEFLEKKDIPLIGNRSLREITERLMDQAADEKESPLSKETADLIENYLSISGPPKAAGARIDDLVSTAGLDISAAMKAYMRRLDLFSKAGIDIAKAQFSAEFGRNLEYYTGLVFQLEIPELGRTGQIAGGGRYDGLLESIGAPKSVPAVGLAIHTERLLVAVQGEAE